MMLEREAKVLGKGGDTSEEDERVLIEEVHDAVSDLVELIKTFQNKSKLAQVLTSSLFKRRQDELNAVMDRAIWGLHLGLQVQVGHNVAQVGHDVGQVRHDVAHLVERSTAEAQAESLAEARRSRRQRKLDQIEIPEDHVSITNEMLGKGGFGVVYLADYNGHNAAKVQHITHGLGKPGESDIPLSGPRMGESNALREKAERKAFLRELDAMIRLRNPHTVNVYGAITSLPGRLVLVMELLAGGDFGPSRRRCMATLSLPTFFWMAAEGQRLGTSASRGGLRTPRDPQALPPPPQIRDQVPTSALHGLPQRCWSPVKPPRRATSTALGWWC
ncbi:n/a (Partial), partial [Ectocarpus siliculosus]